MEERKGFLPEQGQLGDGTVSSLYTKNVGFQVSFLAFWICCLLPKLKNPVIIRDSTYFCLAPSPLLPFCLDIA